PAVYMSACILTVDSCCSHLSSFLCSVSSLLTRHPPTSTLFPYTTLFRSSSDIDQVLVPEPMSLPWYLPESIGPPETRIVGRSTLHAPMSVAGVVLSQPARSTTPSSGLARIDSSTSMLARLR